MPLPENSILLIPFLIILSWGLTYLIKRSALRLKIINLPNERSLHTSPTPRGGGLAIVLVWYLGLSILYVNGAVERNLFLALMSGLILAVISFIDDLVGIKFYVRLIIQFATAILAFYFLGALRPLIIPTLEINYPLLVYPFVIVGVVWFINLFNFMDGVDGFASIEAIIICLVLSFYSQNIIPLILLAAVLGFLFWNWPRAKIFMGDVGSTQLGFILVVLGIYFHNTLKFSILNWIMLASPFWFDATLTLIRRIRNREDISQAHRKHAYQRLVQLGFTHLRVDFLLIMINLIIVLMVLVYREVKFLQVPVYIICILMLYFITRWIDRKVPFAKLKP